MDYQNLKKYVSGLICFSIISFYSTYSLASEIYKCSGRFNTASDYLQVYVVSDTAKSGGYLDWNGTRFAIQEDPVWIYAEYIGDTRTDVVYIEKKTLKVMFFSILNELILYAEGSCKKIKPTLLEFRKKYLEPEPKKIIKKPTSIVIPR